MQQQSRTYVCVCYYLVLLALRADLSQALESVHRSVSVRNTFSLSLSHLSLSHTHNLIHTYRFIMPSVHTHTDTPVSCLCWLTPASSD